MLTFEAFTGINNVVPAHRLKASDLVNGQDVDIGLTGGITRRSGYTARSDQCHKNLHQAAGFMLATCGPALTAIHPDGARHVIHPALGSDRVWYCDLPDGRTTYSNGLIQGVTDGFSNAERTIPAPDRLGAVDQAFGGLTPGQYRYSLTYRRADGVESPAASSESVTLSQGGLRLDALPARDGMDLQVYLSGMDGEGGFLIGATSGSSFEWGGRNSELVLPCRTIGSREFPLGTITAFWRGRVLVAQGNVLWASRPMAPHLSDWRDFRPMPSRITAILPMDDGIYVGTDEDLVWLAGTTFDALAYLPRRCGPVVMGSGVLAPGKQVKLGDGTGSGTAGLCIAGGEIVAGFAGGQTFSLTDNRYITDTTEVCATFRIEGGVPQYIAVPQ